MAKDTNREHRALIEELPMEQFRFQDGSLIRRIQSDLNGPASAAMHNMPVVATKKQNHSATIAGALWSRLVEYINWLAGVFSRNRVGEIT